MELGWWIAWGGQILDSMAIFLCKWVRFTLSCSVYLGRNPILPYDLKHSFAYNVRYQYRHFLKEERKFGWSELRSVFGFFGSESVFYTHFSICLRFASTVNTRCPTKLP